MAPSAPRKSSESTETSRITSPDRHDGGDRERQRRADGEVAADASAACTGRAAWMSGDAQLVARVGGERVVRRQLLGHLRAPVPGSRPRAT